MLHFTDEEFAARRAKVIAQMQERQLQVLDRLRPALISTSSKLKNGARSPLE